MLWSQDVPSYVFGYWSVDRSSEEIYHDFCQHIVCIGHYVYHIMQMDVLDLNCWVGEISFPFYCFNAAAVKYV